MVKNARDNVYQAVSGVAKQFSETQEEKETAQPRNESPASGTKPVNVQFPDGGSVNVRDDGDGYHEADIR